MVLLFISFLAGVLTVFTPCVLPILPVVLGGSLTQKDKLRPYVIVASLGISIFLFSLLLKASTLLIDVSPNFWKVFSGGLVLGLGIVTIFPKLWESVSEKIGLSQSSNLLNKASSKGGQLGNVLIGMALGPVFSSCSPTYAFILSVVFQQSVASGVVSLAIYTLGLSFAMLLIAVFGQKLVQRSKWIADPNGWFRQILGILFVLLGIAIITGYDKKLEAALLDNGFIDFTKFDQALLESDVFNNSLQEMEMMPVNQGAPTQEPVTFEDAAEITGITDWINSEPLLISELNSQGKVVLIDFWTYSCINCIRTLPFLKEWHTKYEDDGLVIIGVHAPEFAFEQKIENVQTAVDDFEIEYPVALDNDFTTWRAYENRFWPAKYLIDVNGKVRYEHFGEGAYIETEEKIRELLEEHGQSVNDLLRQEDVLPPISQLQTHETYLGYFRGKNLLINQREISPGVVANYSAPSNLPKDAWSLTGPWNITNEKSIAGSNDSTLSLNFSAKEVYLVMGAENGGTVQVRVDGEIANLGEDVNENGVVELDEFRLYKLVLAEDFLQESRLDLLFSEGVEAHAFTFGS